jgi:hypothetical protein
MNTINSIIHVHSKTFCNGYVPGYNEGISYNLGYSRGVSNSNHDWESSNHDIHAFNYDCPSAHSKDYCNGYTDGYGDEVHDILGNPPSLLAILKRNLRPF